MPELLITFQPCWQYYMGGNVGLVLWSRLKEADICWCRRRSILMTLGSPWPLTFPLMAPAGKSFQLCSILQIYLNMYDCLEHSLIQTLMVMTFLQSHHEADFLVIYCNIATTIRWIAVKFGILFNGVDLYSKPFIQSYHGILKLMTIPPPSLVLCV